MLWDVTSSRLAPVNKVSTGTSAVSCISTFVPHSALSKVSLARGLSQPSTGGGILGGIPRLPGRHCTNSLGDHSSSSSGELKYGMFYHSKKAPHCGWFQYGNLRHIAVLDPYKICFYCVPPEPPLMIGVGSQDGRISAWTPCHETKKWEIAFKISSQSSSTPIEAMFSPCGRFLEVITGDKTNMKKSMLCNRSMALNYSIGDLAYS